MADLENLNSILTRDFNQMLQCNAVLQRERDEARSALREANVKIAAVRKHTTFHESLADECERGNGGEYAVGRAEGIRDYARDIHSALSEGESAPTLASALREARAIHESHPSKSA